MHAHVQQVPFGRFGFMPGQLYHTNDLLVLLGDNWFARRSAKQAIEIAERRKQCQGGREGGREGEARREGGREGGREGRREGGREGRRGGGVAITVFLACCTDVCEMLEKERKQLQDWEARHAFVDEFSATVEVGVCLTHSLVALSPLSHYVPF